MLKEIKLPDLGEGIDSADVSEILVSPGDNVSVDDIILVLESEKASMEIPSEDNGVVKKVFVSSGDVVKTGEILIMLEVAKSSESKVEKKDIKEETKKIDVLIKELHGAAKDLSEHLDDKEIFDVATKLLRDTGIKSRIIKQYVPIINKLVNKYLAAMDFFVQFELDENFNEVIKSRFRDEFSYASFSEGEKMRIDLSLLFTWRAIAKLKNSASTNLLIMDEVFDSSLDAQGTDEFLKIINDLTGDTNIFIISHKTDQLIDKFSNVLRFEKHQNFSRIAA